MAEPFHERDGLQIFVGDCRAVLRELAAGSVHAVVTSPPYWGLRDYGVAGQLGLEATPEEYVADMVEIFREVRRVLRDDGTVWLNLGDTYVSSPKGPGGDEKSGLSPSGVRVQRTAHRTAPARPATLKPKDLVGIPWRVAFALQEDGWYLRRDIVWAKPNPMPESVTDRPTSSHEYLFLLAKSPRYYYDAEAVREEAVSHREARYDPRAAGEVASIDGLTRHAGRSTRRFAGQKTPAGWDTDPETRHDDTPAGRYRKQDAGVQINGGDRMTGFNDRWAARGRRPTGWADSDAGELAGRYDTEKGGPPTLRAGRNLRSVWTIATEPYPGAHFATFPRKLVEPCIRASTSERGVCGDCGAPWTRVVEVEPMVFRHSAREAEKHAAGLITALHGTLVKPAERATTGWQPSCAHGRPAGDYDAIASPSGAGGSDDPTRRRGRRGLARGRQGDEGVRTMLRWEQRAYARQLRDSPQRELMAADAGPAFAHYLRTDASGARAVPPALLERWLAEGWIHEPEEPVRPASPLAPAVVLDPFAGSGTTGLMARVLGRRAILIDLNPDYARQAIIRTSAGLSDPGGQEVVDGSIWAIAE